MKSFTFDITFASKSKEEYERWMDALSQLQKETEQKRKEQMKKQNVKSNSNEDRQEVKLGKLQNIKKFWEEELIRI